MTQLFANRTWFDFRILNRESMKGSNTFAVYAFSGTETVSEPFEFTIELVTKNSNMNLTELLGAETLLTFADKSGKKRKLHGIIRQMEQLHTANLFTHYKAVVVPRLWFMGQTQDHRIYQHLTVPQIVDQVIKKHSFLATGYEFKLCATYQKREYTVQYGESDLHFLARLCEEEGIYYYFEHNETNHCLCFADTQGGPAIEGENPVRFYGGSGHRPDTAVISRLDLRHRINSDGSTYREWNFTTPNIDLTSQEREMEWEKAPTPIAMDLETYQFPHLYQTKDEGKRYVNLQLQRQLTFRQWIECEADVARFLPGFTFSVKEHPRSDVNRGWWVVSVHHEGEQPEVLEHESPDDRGLTYKATMKAIPDDTRFIPELMHKKVRIEGLQSAIVTGPGGEEIYPDKYGRVKVQFQWDRLGNHDEKTTCWVRVADTWAGVNFGFIQIPRINQEVMVEFMEGDPDRPVITGRVYNENLMPPWQLPQQKSLSGIQSREIKAARRNQLVLDDTQGEIQSQLSSDHDLSQLNLGYITRVNHIEGRKDFRGEGFELRTDTWGVVRAGKGLYVSTDIRSKAAEHQKDVKEATKKLEHAATQHKNQLGLAVKHEAQVYGEHEKPLSNVLDKQNEDIKGTGKPHGEFLAPHMVFSSPSGIAATAFESTHLHSGDHTSITAGSHISLASNKSFLATAIERVSIFAHSLGMKLFAGSGKVEIQAQSDALDLIADKVLQIISAKEKVHISSPKEILLTAGKSYIKINGDGIEQGTSGEWKAHAAQHTMVGGKTMDYLTPTFQKGEAPPLARLVITDELGRVLEPERDAVNATGEVEDKGEEKHKLQLFHGDQNQTWEQEQVHSNGSKVNVITGNVIHLGPEEQDDLVEQEDKK